MLHEVLRNLWEERQERPGAKKKRSRVVRIRAPGQRQVTSNREKRTKIPSPLGYQGGTLLRPGKVKLTRRTTPGLKIKLIIQRTAIRK